MQKIKKSGLPENISMRHDDHFVDLISARTVGPRIRMIPVDKIDPNPQQARSELGNIQELMASIKAKGILAPILVRPKNDRYEIIAGERRFVASKSIGLKEIPCIEMHVKDNEALELALIENVQRKDLDSFEEADGLKALVDIYAYSHNDLADKIGKARSTITEIINVAKIPQRLRLICKQNNISSRSTLVEIAKLYKIEDMEDLIHEIMERGLRREDTRDLSKMIKGKLKKEDIKPFTYNYVSKEDRSFHLKIEFKKQTVSREEIIHVLEDLLKKLKTDKP